MLNTHIGFPATHIACYMVTFFCKMVIFCLQNGFQFGLTIWVNHGPSDITHSIEQAQ